MTRKGIPFFPFLILALWQAFSTLGYGQVVEARTWIEGMT